MRAFLLLALMPLASCGHPAPMPPPEPIIKSVPYAVATPVPCKALTDLGDDPTYPDTDKALAAAPNVAERVRLLLKGRIARTKRLGAYMAARVSCL